MRTISVLDDVPARRSDQTAQAGHTADRTIQGSHQTYTKCQRSMTHPMHFVACLYGGSVCISIGSPYTYVLSLFFIVCSRKVKGAGGWNRTNRNGAYLSVLRLRWWRALRLSMRSVQSPDCSQGTPIPSLYLSRVPVGAVFSGSRLNAPLSVGWGYSYLFSSG